MVRRLSRAISVSPGSVRRVARSPSRARRPAPVGTATSARAALPLSPVGGGSVTRTLQARAPRTISPTSTPATAGATARARAAASSPARAAPGPGTIVTLGPLTTTPLFTSTTPRTRDSSPAISSALLSATTRSSHRILTSIGCGVVVRSPITSSTSCPNSMRSAGCVVSMRRRRSSAIASAPRRRPGRSRST